MSRNRPINPPPYNQNPWSQPGYNPLATINTNGRRDDSERNTLLPKPAHDGSITIPISVVKLLSVVVFGLIGLSVITVMLNYPSLEGIRRERDAEERRHQAMREAWNLEREAMAVERENLRRERAEQENRQRREDEEKRKFIVWQDLKASSKCLRYGTREYSATLAHVPTGLDPLQECWKKSIDIHGRQVFPSSCNTEGMCGAVVGRWIVDFNEGACVTWWRGYDNKGCVEPGIHRYESVLENLQHGDDWHEMCATTPGYPQGRYFAGPTSCASWRSGINAIWLVEDGNCY